MAFIELMVSIGHLQNVFLENNLSIGSIRNQFVMRRKEIAPKMSGKKSFIACEETKNKTQTHHMERHRMHCTAAGKWIAANAKYKIVGTSATTHSVDVSNRVRFAARRVSVGDTTTFRACTARVCVALTRSTQTHVISVVFEHFVELVPSLQRSRGFSHTPTHSHTQTFI